MPPSLNRSGPVPLARATIVFVLAAKVRFLVVCCLTYVPCKLEQVQV